MYNKFKAFSLYTFTFMLLGSLYFLSSYKATNKIEVSDLELYVNKTPPKIVLKKVSYKGIYIGDREEKVQKIFGYPDRVDLSIYDFFWYIYKKNYNNYCQIGIKDNRVVAIFSNSNYWRCPNRIRIGQKRDNIDKLLQNKLSILPKADEDYYLNDENWEVYIIDDYYTTFFYDKYEQNKLDSILVVQKSTEDNLENYYGKQDKRRDVSLELEIFDITNAFRAKNKKNTVIWDEKIANTSRKHSQDMAENNYFNHLNRKGENPFERIIKDGIFYRKAAENIAYGQRDPIYTVEAWLNSLTHRKSMLEDFTNLGVGVYQGGKYKMYYTQNFYTPLEKQ